MAINHSYLLQCSAEKDAIAFRQLYDETYSILYGVARRFLSNHHTTEDVLQESYMKIWIKASTFDAKKYLALAWLCTITKNTALDKLRAERSRPIKTDEVNNITSSELKPDDLLTHYNATKDHLKLIRKLKPDQIQCLIFFIYYGYSHSELSQKFGVPLGTVKSWIRRNSLLTSQIELI